MRLNASTFVLTGRSIFAMTHGTPNASSGSCASPDRSPELVYLRPKARIPYILCNKIYWFCFLKKSTFDIHIFSNGTLKFVWIRNFDRRSPVTLLYDGTSCRVGERLLINGTRCHDTYLGFNMYLLSRPLCWTCGMLLNLVLIPAACLSAPISSWRVPYLYGLWVFTRVGGIFQWTYNQQPQYAIWW